MFFKFFERKRQKEYQALLKSSAAFVRIETLDDSDEYIEIVFPPLSDDEINRLQFLLDKGVKISNEDLDFIKKSFDEYIQKLYDEPDMWASEDYPFDENLSDDEFKKWVENHPRINIFKLIYSMLEKAKNLNA